jgi:hypothetical protein
MSGFGGKADILWQHWPQAADEEANKTVGKTTPSRLVWLQSGL